MLTQETTLHSKQIYKGKILNLRVDTVELTPGKQTKREIVEHDGCVAIVPIDEEDNVLLVRQYRKAAEQVMLEIPAGGIESGEKPLDSAIRELAEETGFSAKQWKEIGAFYTSPGFCTEFMHMFVAGDLVKQKLDADYDEHIEPVRIPIRKIYGLIESGEICDAKSIAGLLMVLREKKI